MKKLFIFAIAVLGMLACSEKNTPDDSTAREVSLPGQFSVDYGKKVQFSQGNLQYKASTGTWRFAGQQYDIIGANNANISSTYSGWIDLFGWGTGNNPTLASKDNKDYSTFVDWGDNAISNGGNKAKTWRTLTADEWEFLFNNRYDADSKKGQATIDGIHGYVFLPDEWICPSEIHFSPNPGNWTTNEYTADKWSQMEQAGAVFLPAAGIRRDGYTIRSVGSIGYYWSSAPYDDDACCFYFDLSISFRGFGHNTISQGYSVRLVRNVE